MFRSTCGARAPTRLHEWRAADRSPGAGRWQRTPKLRGHQLVELREAGAEWAVFAWPGSVAVAVAAADAAGIELVR